VREVVRQSAEELRALQIRILEDHLAARGLEPAIDPQFATFVISSLSQTLAPEDLIGIAAGHDTVRAVVDRAFREFATRGSASLPS